MGDVDGTGSWGLAVSIFEEQRPDLEAPPAGTLTGKGTCVSCEDEDVSLYRTSTSTTPDTCTACRGPVR